jgi:hypothetical protein
MGVPAGGFTAQRVSLGFCIFASPCFLQGRDWPQCVMSQHKSTSVHISCEEV